MSFQDRVVIVTGGMPIPVNLDSSAAKPGVGHGMASDGGQLNGLRTSRKRNFRKSASLV